MRPVLMFKVIKDGFHTVIPTCNKNNSNKSFKGPNFHDIHAFDKCV